jgi:DNA polymerase-1
MIPGVLDFETKRIEARPAYPPEPVGFAIKASDVKSRYYAWKHPSENNCTWHQARKVLKDFMRSHRIICHHAGFDLDVAETWFGMEWPAEHDDTLILAFLEDPDSFSLSLKPLAVRYLNEPPTEQDAVRDFAIARAKAGDPRFHGATKKTFGAYISECPGNLIGKYAIGDVERTWRLYQRFKRTVLTDKRFRQAYERELKVTRSLIRMERHGLPMATARLKRDVALYQATLKEIESPLLVKMKVPAKEWEEFKWSGSGFAEQLLRSKLVKSLPQTEKGNDSTSAESLAEVLPPALAKEFEVRSQIQTCLNTFMQPWLAQARENDDVFYARFNQVRNGDEWGSKTGARTGRLSMTPNLQNVIRSDKDPRVPLLRDYIVRGHYTYLIQRDYSQQELRLLAHYEDGPFLQSYKDNPGQDAHNLVSELIKNTTGLEIPRRPVKDLNFGLIYGQGLTLTAKKMGVPVEDARRARSAHAASLPGIPKLQARLKKLVELNEPIWTWGGRRYYCEPPIFKNGRWYNFGYKMLNKLIQGSAADVTKQAMVNWDEHPLSKTNFMLLQVHDELILGANDEPKKVHKALAECMADVEGIEVPMLSDGKIGFSSWHRMKKVNY